jgi:protein involved in polysaccharide export with SLBB domain
MSWYKGFILIILFSFSIFKIDAQSNISNISKDLSTIKVDDLTDDQIKQLLDKATSNGLTEEQLESQALERGMPAIEVQKLKTRIEKLHDIKDDEKTTDVERQRNREPEKNKIKKEEKKSEDLFNEIIELQNKEKKKKIFGADLFNNKNLTFAPSMSIPTPQDYQVGAGDELIIDVWGASQATYKQKISPEGNIVIPNLGPIFLSGLTIEKASQRIINRLSSIYAGLSGPHPNTFAQISIGNIRSINVTLVGELMTPGTYTIPSLSSVFNALYIAGGPSETGTLRNIKVFRNNKLATTLDVYDFLIKGDQTNNIRLQDQDVIIVDPYSTRVEVEGEVKRPAMYEMKENETVKDLISFCGGYTAKAYTFRSKLIRSLEKEHKILDVISDSFPTLKMHDGDILSVDTILDRFTNKVEIQGAVYRPGQFELTQNMTLYDLIQRADGLKGDAFLSRGILYRTMKNMNIQTIPINIDSLEKGTVYDIPLLKDDLFKVFSIFDLREDYKVQIEGEVLKPGEYPYLENYSLEDLIANAGGFKQSASLAKIEVARRVMDNYADSSSSKIAETFVFSVDNQLSLSQNASKFALKPFDIISVRRSPGYEVQTTVTVQGEVNFVGVYSLTNKNDRISDIIKRAGGLTKDAYIKGARLIRTSIEDENSRKKILKQIEKQSKDSIMIEPVENPSQAIGINLEKIIREPHSINDLVLQDKDVLIIPKELQTVRLSGALLYPITARYDKKYGFRKYISLAGGFSEISNKQKSYVIYANGTVDKTNHFLFFNFYPKVEPGAEIVVPKKPENKNKLTTQESVALSSVITTSLASLGSIIISLVTLSK